jgi:hypothetical protein
MPAHRDLILDSDSGDLDLVLASWFPGEARIAIRRRRVIALSLLRLDPPIKRPRILA